MRDKINSLNKKMEGFDSLYGEFLNSEQNRAILLESSNKDLQNQLRCIEQHYKSEIKNLKEGYESTISLLKSKIDEYRNANSKNNLYISSSEYTKKHNVSSPIRISLGKGNHHIGSPQSDQIVDNLKKK